MRLETKFPVTIHEEGKKKVFCPFCKKKVAHYKTYDLEIEPCDHFAFFYTGDNGFEKMSKEFKDKFLDKFESVGDFSFPESLDEMDFEDDDLHIIDATEYGIACGPASYQMFYVFDKKQQSAELDNSILDYDEDY